MSSTAARPTKSLVRDVLQRVQDLFRSEIRLARAETREELARSARAVATLGMGIVLSLYALGLLLLAGVYVASEFVAPWIAALLVFGVVAIVAGITVGIGLGKVRKLNPKPERTVHTTKEGIHWAKSHAR